MLPRELESEILTILDGPADAWDRKLRELRNANPKLAAVIEEQANAMRRHFEEPHPEQERPAENHDEAREVVANEHPDLAPQPRHIGQYEIIELIGQGGMGSVYLAEQREPIRRRVALKLVKLGMDSVGVVNRFEQERQALAVMEHDGIAKVFDCGTNERGQPFFVMEYVEGQPLTTYANQHRLRLAERIELVQQICIAVTHAHQKGVVHRDLKPGNVLVNSVDGKARVKIIDFGLAKAVGTRLLDETLVTQIGQLLGTPEYMAPEQADLGSRDVDTRADVYALGVILYELLVGELPFSSAELRGSGLVELQRKLQNDDPPKPSARLADTTPASEGLARSRQTTASALKHALRQDLDWVVLKALEKDRDRRYQSAEALGADLERFLNKEPVSAGPPSAGYRLAKFVRRHRLPILATTAVLVAIVGGVVAAALGMARAAKADYRAATRLANELAQHRSAATTCLSERDWSGARARAEAAREISAALHDPVLAEATSKWTGQVLATVESSQQKLRDASESAALLAELENVHQPSSLMKAYAPRWGRTARDYAAAFRSHGYSPLSDSTDAVAARLRARIQDPATLVAVVGYLDSWAMACQNHDDVESGRRLLQVALRADDDEQRVQLRQQLVATDKTPLDRSEFAADSIAAATAALFGDSLLTQGRLRSGLRWYLAAEREHRGNYVITLGLARAFSVQAPPRNADALPYYRAALSLRPSSTAASHELARTLLELGRASEAEVVLRDAMTGTSADGHLWFHLAQSMEQQGRIDSCIDAYRRAIAADSDDPIAKFNLGKLCYETNRLEEAETYLREAIAQKPDYIKAYRALASTYTKMQRNPEAAALLTGLQKDHPNNASVALGLATVRYAMGQDAEAIRILDEVGPDRQTAESIALRGLCLIQQKDYPGAERALLAALQRDPEVRNVQLGLAIARFRLGRTDESIEAGLVGLEQDPDDTQLQNVMLHIVKQLPDLEQSIRVLTEVCEIATGSPRAATLLGDARLKQGMRTTDPTQRKDHLEAAVRSFQRAVELAPDAGPNHYNLGIAASANADLPLAALAFQRAVDLQPGSRQGHYNLGTVLGRLGRNKEAIKTLEVALAGDSNHPEAWCNLGHCLLAEFRYAEAKQAFAEGRARGLQQPNWSYAVESIDWLEQAKAGTERARALSSIDTDDLEATDVDELLQAAVVAAAAGQHERSVKLADHGLAQKGPDHLDLSYGYRLRAAMSAARVVLDNPAGAARSATHDATKLLRRIDTWLTQDLANCRRVVEEQPQPPKRLRKHLRMAAFDPDLLELRAHAMTGADAGHPEAAKGIQAALAGYAELLDRLDP